MHTTIAYTRKVQSLAHGAMHTALKMLLLDGSYLTLVMARACIALVVQIGVMEQPER